MKSIIVVAKHPFVSATFQDVLGLSGHRFLLVSDLREMATVLEDLDPEKPDLVAMASDASDPAIKMILAGLPGLHERMVIMAMDPDVDDTLTSLVPVSVCQRSNDPESAFFKRCREILGE